MKPALFFEAVKINLRRGLPVLLAFSVFSRSSAQTVPRSEWGAPSVIVVHTAGDWNSPGYWTISGLKQTVTLNESNLALEVNAQSVIWKMPAAATNEMLVEQGGKEFPLRLTDAGKISIEPYDTGFKTGVKITLSDWKKPHSLFGDKLDLTLYLTICLQGDDEDLVFDIAAKEGGTVLRRLDWPPPLDASDVDYTVLSNNKGDLLPRHWPHPYYPIRSTDANGFAKTNDHSIIQSHVIEDWSMSWWGFLKGKSAMMVIVETPDDAAYQFSHPGGGPTVIGPEWRYSLGRFS